MLLMLNHNLQIVGKCYNLLILSLLIQDYENKNFVIKADKKLTA